MSFLWTTAELRRLETLPKRITGTPRKQLKADQGSLRDTFDLLSLDGQHRFAAFIRVCEAFPEDFSIGLNYFPAGEGSLVRLLRCNGRHGQHRTHAHHGFCHIHRPDPADLNEGNFAERTIEITEAYDSWQRAVWHFCALAAVQDAAQHFEHLLQFRLSLGGEFET